MRNSTDALDVNGIIYSKGGESGLSLGEMNKKQLAQSEMNQKLQNQLTSRSKN